MRKWLKKLSEKIRLLADGVVLVGAVIVYGIVTRGRSSEKGLDEGEERL